MEDTVPPQDPLQARTGIVEILRDAHPLVLTGAGVSTESGIPDYRGPHGSLKRHRPMTYQEFQHDDAARQRYWARGFVGWGGLDEAEPNRVHRAITVWEQRGLIAGVVTQNVDGLHRRAGTRNLVTLHGDMAHVVCLDCGAEEDRESLDARMEAANPGYRESVRVHGVNPDGDVTLDDADVQRFRMVACLVCGSTRLKPDVVYFGENVPAERKARVDRMQAESGSLLVLGSSVAVMSGYRLVLQAVRAGQPVGVINDGPGRGDPKADWRWRTQLGPAVEWLTASL